MSRLRVYVAGPIMRGDRAANIRRGIEAGEAVLQAGLLPFIPFLNEAWHDLFPKTHDEWLSFDLPWLETCHAVLRLPGESKGADMEESHARLKGIPVFYELAKLVTWARSLKLPCSFDTTALTEAPVPLFDPNRVLADQLNAEALWGNDPEFRRMMDEAAKLGKP